MVYWRERCTQVHANSYISIGMQFIIAIIIGMQTIRLRDAILAAFVYDAALIEWR